MYSNNVTQFNSYEYFDIEQFDKLDQTDICEMCDGYHNGSQCMQEAE